MTIDTKRWVRQGKYAAIKQFIAWYNTQPMYGKIKVDIDPKLADEFVGVVKQSDTHAANPSFDSVQMQLPLVHSASVSANA